MTVSCEGQAQEESKEKVGKIWSSQFGAFSVELSDKWKQTTYSDTKEKVMLELVYNQSSVSYFVKISRKMTKLDLTDSECNASMIESMSYIDQNFVLIKENDTIFHGQTFHQFIFDSDVENKGVIRMHFLFNRTDLFSNIIHLIYPIDEKQSKTAKLPKELIELDRHVTLRPMTD